MSPRRCVIADCESISGKPQHIGVTFHMFPQNIEIRKRWLKVTRVDRALTKSILVCSRHFRMCDFQRIKNNKFVLKQGATPSIFPWEKFDSSQDASVYNEKEENPMNDSAKVTTGDSDTLGSAPLIKQEPIDDYESPPKKIYPIKQQPQPPTLDSFVSGATIEAQDFQMHWHTAKVIEVDSEEREVFIHFEKVEDLKDEWIPMNSSRLRMQQTPKDSKHLYKLGEQVLARWNDSRKFPATVQGLRDNDMYEVLFEDGFSKTVKSQHVTKRKLPNTPNTSITAIQTPTTSIPSTSEQRPPAIAPTPQQQPSAPPPTPTPPVQERLEKTTPHQAKQQSFNKNLDVTKMNIPQIPKDGEWACHWINDCPIGKESFLEGPDGNRKRTVLVEDWRLPANWAKHMYQRSSISGKWDVVLVGPTKKKRFRSKNDIKTWLEENNQTYSPDVYDFSIHKRRAKDLGAYVYTEEYQKYLDSKMSEAPPNTSIASPQIPTVPKEMLVEVKKTVKPTITKKVVSEIILPQQKEKLPPAPTHQKVVVQKTPALKLTEQFDGNKTAPPILTSAASTLPPPRAAEPLGLLPPGFVYIGSLMVEVKDRLFKCPGDNCEKTFRKENHLQVHVKHYHKELSVKLGVCPNMTDLAYLRQSGSEFIEPLATYSAPAVSARSRQESNKRRSLQLPRGRKLNISAVTEDKKMDSELLTPKKEVMNFNDIIQSPPAKVAKLAKVVPTTPKEVKPHVFKMPVDVKPSSEAPVVMPSAIVVKPTQASPFSSNCNDFEDLIQKSMITSKLSAANVVDSMMDTSPVQLQSADSTISDDMKMDEVSDAANSSTKFIQENGEIIKIVRMRQEEIINCLCRYTEEDGLMIQCDLCLCWQHGSCNSIEKESDVPEKYVCFICKNPERGRKSHRFNHDQDWLFDGKMPTSFTQTTCFAKEVREQQRSDMLKKTHTMFGNLVEVERFLHSLRVKSHIAENPNHPKLYLWSKDWEAEDEEKKPSIDTLSDDANDLFLPNSILSSILPQSSRELMNMLSADDGKQIDLENPSILANLLASPATPPSMTHSKQLPSTSTAAINLTEQLMGDCKDSQSSEHDTFNQPGTSKDAIRRDKELEDQRRDIEEMAKLEHDLDTAEMIKLTNDAARAEAALLIPCTAPVPEAAIDPVDCQIRLLDHILAEQKKVDDRLDFISEQIDSISANGNINMDVINDEQLLKNTMQLLLKDVRKVGRYAEINMNTEAAQASIADPTAPW